MDGVTFWNGVGHIVAGAIVLAMGLHLAHTMGFELGPKEDKTVNMFTFCVVLFICAWATWWVGRWW